MDNDYRDYRMVPGLDSIICDVLNEEFDVKCRETGHIWFGPWEDDPWEGHCRKVFELYALKSSLYPIQWGYNFDFMPWDSCFSGYDRPDPRRAGKLVYHRTDKSAKIDIGGWAFPYIDYDFYNPSKYSFDEHKAFRTKYFVPTCGFENEMQENIEKIKAVVRRNIPFMLDWFSKWKTIDDFIDSYTKSITENETEHSFPFGGYWVRGFLFARQHNIDAAISDISRVYEKMFKPSIEIPERVRKKLYEVSEM